jgi:hypothetical protein
LGPISNHHTDEILTEVGTMHAKGSDIETEKLGSDRQELNHHSHDKTMTSSPSSSTFTGSDDDSSLPNPEASTDLKCKGITFDTAPNEKKIIKSQINEEAISEEKVEEPMKQTDQEKETQVSTDDHEDEILKRKKNMKKVGVAVAGGALITAGIPLIPVLCAGELMIIGGMALLATEFDSAKKVMDKGREKLTEFAEKEEDGGLDPNRINEGEPHDLQLNEEVTNKSGNDEVDSSVEKRGVKIARNVKRSLRNMVKNDVLPMLDKIAPVKNGDEETKSSVHLGQINAA